MDVRENGQDLEEIIRAAVAGVLKNHWTAMPTSVSEDSKDGHVATHTPTIKRAVTDPTDGSTTYEDHPLHPDAPIHHMGGGPTVVTHPTKEGDTGLAIYASRSIDSWFQNGGSQNPIEDRMHSLADAVFLSGIRSTPDKLQQVSQESTQTRTIDKKSVIDHGPNGTHHKTVDPSTEAASASFDPFTSATKFHETKVHPTDGHMSASTDGGTTHSSTITHADGFKAMANNGAHSVSAHPDNGTSILSSVAHTLQAPNASLDKDGNQTNQGKSASGGDVSSATKMSSPIGQFPSGFLGNLSLGSSGLSGPPSSNGFVSIGAMDIAAPVLQSNAQYTVAQLNQEMPATAALAGTRAYVTDAQANPTFLQLLTGGGQQGCPAICIYSAGTTDSNGNNVSGYIWVAG